MSNQNRRKRIVSKRRRRGNGGNGVKNNVTTPPNQVSSVDWDKYPQTVLRFKGIIMPDRFCTNLLYYGKYRVNNAAVAGQQIFRGNSCYDPDYTGSGGQPMGFDQLAFFYNKYRVTKSSLTVDLVNTTLSFDMTITPSNSFTTPATCITARENPYNKNVTVSSGISNFSTTSSISTYRIWGVRPQTVLDEDGYAATVTADPANPWAWVINTESFDNTTVMTVWLNLKMTYQVEFFDRYPIAQS